MKLYIIILSFLLFACIDQLERESNSVADLVTYINTYGEAMDADLNENSMIVAANYHGFIVYDVNRDAMGDIVSVDSVYNDSILDDSMGDNRAQEVIISQSHDIAFITDIYDRIWLHKLDQSATQYVDYYLQDCYGGTWLSTAIDDESNPNAINVFSLVKHSSSESDDEGTIGDFDEYSTSVVWKGIYDINGTDLFPEQNASPSCEFVSSGNVDDDRVVCENPTFDYYNPGLGGIFEPNGGFYPYVHSSFDLSGEVNSVFVKDLVVFAGLSTSNGCYISLLDDNGDIIDNLSIANGYSINNISEDNGIVALSAGHDGCLLYQWNGGLNIDYIGQIETPYSNHVKVDGNNIIVSTEDGIYIYNLK